MTIIKGGTVLRLMPSDLLICPSCGAVPVDLAASGATRRSRPEPPVTASLHPGRRFSRPVAPHREEQCSPRPRHVHLETTHP